MEIRKSYKSRKNAPWLFAIGILDLWYGFSLCYIQVQWGGAGAWVSLIGLACLLASFGAWRDNKEAAAQTSRLWRYAVIWLALAGLGAGVAAVNYLAFRYDRRWDLTQARQHTLTGATVHLLTQLKEKVELIAFYVGLPPKYLEDLFKEYERLSGGKIKASIVDPLVEIGYAAQFGNVISGKEKKIIVRSSGGRKDVDFTHTPLTEEQVTNAMRRVMREERRIYFLAGHGEYSIDSDEDKGLKTLTQMLAKNNMESRSLLFAAQGRIPGDCDVLVIAGPSEPLPAGEEQMIQEYLEKGGDALFLVEHTVITTPDKTLTEEERQKNPSLNSLLAPWGVRIADDVVVDLASHASGDVGSPATRHYMPHEAIVKDLDYTFYVRPRSISIVGNRRSAVKVAPLVLTASAEKSWGESNRNLVVEYDRFLDRAGPVPIAFVMAETRDPSVSLATEARGAAAQAAPPGLAGDDGKEKSSDTRLAVFTDTDFLSNAFIDQYSNAEMGLNVINWLSELDYQVFTDHKDAEVERLDLTSGQKRMVAVILWSVPVFIAAGGMIVWMKQRG